MNNKIKQFIAFGICSVIALALCLVVLVVTVNNLEKDQYVSQVTEVQSLTQLTESKKVLINYFNTLVENTENRFVKTKRYTDISVNELVVSKTSNNKASDEALLSFAVNKILPTLDSYYGEDFEGTFIDNNSNKLSLVFNEKYVKNAAYSVGQVDENGKNILDDEGNIVDNEFYYLNFVIDGECVLNNKKLSKMFLVNNDTEAKANFVDASKENIKTQSIKSEPENFEIKVKVNRVTDKIEYINVIRNYIIKVNVDFVNKADLFGAKEFSFVYTVNDTYEYSYAGISFVENEITLGLDEEYMLNVNAIIDDDSEYTVEFSSSDADIISVDEMGYVKTHKASDQPVIITVKLNYLNKIFTDTCIVNINEE